MLAHYSFTILQLFFHQYHRSMTVGGLLGQLDCVVYGAFACLDCFCAGSVDGCSGPGAGFLLSSSGMGLLVGDALVVAGLRTSRMWTLFHLSSCPWGVVSMYDLGSSLFSRICFPPLPSLMVLQACRLSSGKVWEVFRNADHGTSSGLPDAAIAPGRCCPLAAGCSALW